MVHSTESTVQVPLTTTFPFRAPIPKVSTPVANKKCPISLDLSSSSRLPWEFCDNTGLDISGHVSENIRATTSAKDAVRKIANSIELRTKCGVPQQEKEPRKMWTDEEMKMLVIGCNKHTIYEAEVVGITLALHLLTLLNRRIKDRIAIGTDSQATIKALLNQRPHPGHHLLDQVHTMVEVLHTKQYRLLRAHDCRLNSGQQWLDKTCGIVDLQLHWTPGHLDFYPNERADELAKEAALGTSSPATQLPAYLRPRGCRLHNFMCR
ncbi:hypothetical protein H0H92_005991, partial [Tricholoma furcatifolium]